MKWKCTDGRVLDHQEIETNHLRNIIGLLRRKGVVTLDEYLSCAAYAASAPDGAAMCAENELEGMRPWKGLEILEAELESRK